MTLDFQSKASLMFVSIFIPTDCSLLNHNHDRIHVCDTLVFVSFTGLNAMKILSHQLEAMQNKTVFGIAVLCIFVAYEFI